MKQQQTNEAKTVLARRGFLMAAGAGSVGAAAVVATVALPKAPEHAVSLSSEASRGYHTSAHINEYYATARI